MNNNDKEIKSIMNLGATKVYTIDPNNKSHLQKTTMTILINDAKSHLTKNKKVHFVLVKE